MPFGLSWLTRTCSTRNVQCTEQAGQIVDRLIPSRAPVSMNLGEWEISLRRNGLEEAPKNYQATCSDAEGTISTRVSTANVQARFMEGLTEIEDDESFEAFDIAPGCPNAQVSDVADVIGTQVTSPPGDTDEIFKEEKETKKADERPCPHRKRKALKRIFKTIPVLVNISTLDAPDSQEALGAAEERGEPTRVEVAPSTEVQSLNDSVPMEYGAVVEMEPESCSASKHENPISLVASGGTGKSSAAQGEPSPKASLSPLESGTPPLDETPIASMNWQKETQRPTSAQETTRPFEACRMASSMIPNLRLPDTVSCATVVKKDSHRHSVRASGRNFKGLVTQASDSSHEPFSGTSEPPESQSASCEGSPLLRARVLARTARTLRDDFKDKSPTFTGSSTSRDLPVQIMKVPVGKTKAPSTLVELRAVRPNVVFQSLTSLIHVVGERLKVTQNFLAQEVIAIIDPAILYYGRDQSCTLGMARHVPRLSSGPGFPRWADTNASFINRMSLTVARHGLGGQVTKGIFPYCHLLFGTGCLPNVQCLFHSHQLCIVALQALAVDTALAAELPSLATSVCFNSLLSTGSRADINHFSLHAETPWRKDSKVDAKAEQVHTETGMEKGLPSASELPILTTESTEPSREVVEVLSDDVVTEDCCCEPDPPTSPFQKLGVVADDGKSKEESSTGHLDPLFSHDPGLTMEKVCVATERDLCHELGALGEASLQSEHKKSLEATE